MLKQSAWNSARQVTSILSGSGIWVWITCGSAPDDWLGRVTAYRAVTSFENSDALPCGLVTVDMPASPSCHVGAFAKTEAQAKAGSAGACRLQRTLAVQP